VRATPTWPGWSITTTTGRSTRRWRSANASPRPGSDPRSAPSVSSFDNALAETINGLYKTELATAEWVDWSNHRRLYEHCGDVPPAEMEADH